MDEGKGRGSFLAAVGRQWWRRPKGTKIEGLMFPFVRAGTKKGREREHCHCCQYRYRASQRDLQRKSSQQSNTARPFDEWQQTKLNWPQTQTQTQTQATSSRARFKFFL